MADEAVPTRVTLDALFEKAGIRVEGAVRLKSLKLELQCLRYAQCYVAAHFDPRKAYETFCLPRKPRPSRGKNWESWWLTGPKTAARVAFHIRQLVQEATIRAQDKALLDVKELLDINQTLILADATDLIEQATDKDGRIYTRFKPAHLLTAEQRMSVKTIRIKDGEVTMMQTYDRLAAQSAQFELLKLLSERGGGDQNWVGRWRAKVAEARARRIQVEVDAGVASGKVLKLPGHAK
jgi:hypothetical protein